MPSTAVESGRTSLLDYVVRPIAMFAPQLVTTEANAHRFLRHPFRSSSDCGVQSHAALMNLRSCEATQPSLHRRP
ncbi:hypothetical protein ACP70R_035865 [Stipagrostis hirtigluma subsp. patula]